MVKFKAIRSLKLSDSYIYDSVLRNFFRIGTCYWLHRIYSDFHSVFLVILVS